MIVFGRCYTALLRQLTIPVTVLYDSRELQCNYMLKCSDMHSNKFN